MRRLLKDIFRRGVALAIVFVVGVSIFALRVYYLDDETLGSDPLDVSSLKEEYLLRWHTPFAIRVTIPSEADLTGDSLRLRPNPLFLCVLVDNQYRLFLNSHQYGTLDDPRLLTEQLSSLFLERRLAGAYRAERDELTGAPVHPPVVEKTVNVEVPYTLSYGEVVSLIDAIKTAKPTQLCYKLMDVSGER